ATTYWSIEKENVMNRKWRLALLPALAVGVALVMAGLSAGQRRDDDRREPPPRDGRGREPVQIDKEEAAGLDILVKEITDPQETTRATGRTGTGTVARRAWWLLGNMGEGDDEATAEAARKLIANIEQRGLRNPFGPPDGCGPPDGRRPPDGPRGPFGVEQV